MNMILNQALVKILSILAKRASNVFLADMNNIHYVETTDNCYFDNINYDIFDDDRIIEIGKNTSKTILS
jgi:hypothetical protein